MRSIRARDTQFMHHILTSLSEPLIYLISFLTVFLETGIVGFFFLPGDTLLFSLGLFARQGITHLGVTIPVIVLAGFIGNIVGYYLGSFVRGKRSSSSLLRKIPEKHIKRTELFYEKYGSWTVVLSRFVPIVRTVAPFLAGVSNMSRRKFIALSLFGAILWGSIITLIGYLFGKYINLQHIVYISFSLMIIASIATPIALFISHRYLKKG